MDDPTDLTQTDDAAAKQTEQDLSTAAVTRTAISPKYADRLVREAARQGATYVQTPEITNLVERDGARMRAEMRTEADDATLAHLRALLRAEHDHGISVRTHRCDLRRILLAHK